MIKHGNPLARGLILGGIAAAGLLTLGACANQSPESVCGSPETLRAVRGLLLDTMARGVNVDRPAFEEAFAKMATIELITFEGRDDQTKIIRCRAQVRTTGTTSQFAIDFSRQPTVDTGFVYGVDFDGTDAWNALGMALMPHVILGTQMGSSEETATRDTGGALSLEEAPQGSTTMHQYQDADGNWPEESRPPIAREQGPAAPQPTRPGSVTLRPELPSPAAATSSATSSSPPPVTIPQKVDRIEYAGPPVIVPGPPPPPAPLTRRLSVVRDPFWSRPPLPEFPERALSLGLETGTVALNCQMRPDGSLTDCDVVSESPTDAGFAAAALQAARRALVSPATVSSAAPGARLTFTSRFRP